MRVNKAITLVFFFSRYKSKCKKIQNVGKFILFSVQLNVDMLLLVNQFFFFLYKSKDLSCQ